MQSTPTGAAEESFDQETRVRNQGTGWVRYVSSNFISDFCGTQSRPLPKNIELWLVSAKKPTMTIKNHHGY